MSYYRIGARYYDSDIGGWVSVDPMRQFASPYLYAGNGANPLNGVDEDGCAYITDKDGYVIDVTKENPNHIYGANGEFAIWEAYGDPDAGELLQLGDRVYFNYDKTTMYSNAINSLPSDLGIIDRYKFAGSESLGKMDFRNTLPAGYKFFTTSMMHAYSYAKMGNYMWGAGMKRLGFSYGMAWFGSNANNALWGNRKDNPGIKWTLWDNKFDQTAINRGYGASK